MKRRDFIKKTTLGAVGVAGVVALAGCKDKVKQGENIGSVESAKKLI